MIILRLAKLDSKAEYLLLHMLVIRHDFLHSVTRVNLFAPPFAGKKLYQELFFGKKIHILQKTLSKNIYPLILCPLKSRAMLWFNIKAN